MTAEPQTVRSRRVLVLAPVGRDAPVLVQTLAGNGIEARQCASVVELCREMAAGAGAAVIAGEALVGPDRSLLVETLAQQPEWSDFPLVIMDTRRSEGTRFATLAARLTIGHAVVLVRPVHAHTLVTAVQSALRSRQRQYEVRDELAERRRAERALREANDRKDEFLAMLGHELRNPLAAIRNATELLQICMTDDDRLAKAHGVLERQSGHMARLIDGLLEVSRVARGKIHLEKESVDLRHVVRQGLADRTPELQSRGLHLETRLPDEPVWVDGDRVRLMQVFDNLLGNAVKFSNTGGSIRVSLAADAGGIALRVRDFGIGIRPDMLERLFDPFQQDTQDMARAAGGLGLGLALAKGLVELHDGRISAHSAGPDEGALFEVWLPAGGAARVSAPDAAAAQDSTPRRVLIVEDNVDAGQSLRDLLSALGHDASIVTDAPAALNLLETTEVDVALCDLGLPGMTGYELAQALRSNPATRSMCLVAVTGYGQPSDRERTAAAGFDHHLTKPVDAASLTSVLRSLAG